MKYLTEIFHIIKKSDDKKELIIRNCACQNFLAISSLTDDRRGFFSY